MPRKRPGTNSGRLGRFMWICKFKGQNVRGTDGTYDMTGQMGHVHGTDGTHTYTHTHTKGGPAKMFFMFIVFSFPN